MVVMYSSTEKIRGFQDYFILKFVIVAYKHKAV